VRVFLAESDYYKILGVPTTATSSEIKRRYLELCKKIHPDHGGDDSLMAFLNEAYKTLSEPALREQYDGRNNSSQAQQGAQRGYSSTTEPKPRPRPAYTRPGNQQNYSSSARTGTYHQPTEPILTEKQKQALAALRAQITKTEWHIQHGTGYWVICGFGAFVILAGWSSPYVSQTSLVLWSATLSIIGAYLYQQMVKRGLWRLYERAGLPPSTNANSRKGAGFIFLAFLAVLFILLASSNHNSSTSDRSQPTSSTDAKENTSALAPAQSVIDSKKQYYAPANAASFTAADESSFATSCLSRPAISNYPSAVQIRYCGCALGSVEQNYTPTQLEEAQSSGSFSAVKEQSNATITKYCNGLL
jgi:hypothetical protein